MAVHDTPTAMTTAVDSSAAEHLRRRIGGTVILPNDAGYDEARTVFNAMIDRRPGVIVQCAGTQDVVQAVRFGREQGLEIAVRGGGHSVAGKALTEGGIVIDLRRMNGASVDAAARTVTLGGGATMSHLDRATEPHGLATTGGRVSTTGVGGFTLGGGGGWLDRKFGLACDNLVSVELVTAGGEVVTASAEQNADLFWALHGGGGNFGVATSLTLRLHSLAGVTVMLLIWRPEAGPKVLRAYRDFVAEAPDEVGGGLIYLTAPALDFVPEALVGKLALAVLIAYAGDVAEAEKAARPMLSLDPDGKMITAMRYADFQCMLDDPPGYRNYWSADYLSGLPDEAIDRFCARTVDMIVPSPSQHVLFPGGGAVARNGEGWPVPWRMAPWCVHPFGLWEKPEDDQRGRRWAHDIRADLKRWATGAVYLNFVGDEGRDRVIAGFGADNYRRLAAIKAEYDPDNVFHINHNIEPAQR